jgi:hypothetical protein
MANHWAEVVSLDLCFDVSCSDVTPSVEPMCSTYICFVSDPFAGEPTHTSAALVMN